MGNGGGKSACGSQRFRRRERSGGDVRIRRFCRNRPASPHQARSGARKAPRHRSLAGPGRDGDPFLPGQTRNAPDPKNGPARRERPPRQARVSAACAGQLFEQQQLRKIVEFAFVGNAEHGAEPLEIDIRGSNVMAGSERRGDGPPGVLLSASAERCRAAQPGPDGHAHRPDS